MAVITHIEHTGTKHSVTLQPGVSLMQGAVANNVPGIDADCGGSCACTQEVMRRVAADLGQSALEWIGTCHFDTDQPHAHVLVRGKRASGADLVIPCNYIA